MRSFTIREYGRESRSFEGMAAIVGVYLWLAVGTVQIWGRSAEKIEEGLQEYIEYPLLKMACCSICLSDVTLETGNATLSCGHTFHIACMVRNIQAAATTCPNCRKPLNEYETVAALSTPIVPPLLMPPPREILNPEDDDYYPPTPRAPIPRVQTYPMIEALYAPNIREYVWKEVSTKGIHHQAAYSKVFTSLLTAQACVRGGLVRRRLRREVAVAAGS